MPWEKPSEFNPDPGQNEALENFLNKVMAYLFDPKNKRKFVDNLTHGEREALRDLSTWNKDEKNPRVIRVQDKGSCFVVDFKAKYVENNLQYVSDPKTFSSDDVDNSISNLKKVSKWTRKWEREGVLGMSECDWIVAGNPKPAKCMPISKHIRLIGHIGL